MECYFNVGQFLQLCHKLQFSRYFFHSVLISFFPVDHELQFFSIHEAIVVSAKTFCKLNILKLFIRQQD